MGSCDIGGGREVRDHVTWSMVTWEGGTASCDMCGGREVWDHVTWNMVT